MIPLASLGRLRKRALIAVLNLTLPPLPRAMNALAFFHPGGPNFCVKSLGLSLGRMSVVNAVNSPNFSRNAKLLALFHAIQPSTLIGAPRTYPTIFLRRLHEAKGALRKSVIFVGRLQANGSEQKFTTKATYSQDYT